MVSMSGGGISLDWWQLYAQDHFLRFCLQLRGPDNFKLFEPEGEDVRENECQEEKETSIELPPGFLALKLKRETLDRYELPDALYPVAFEFAAMAAAEDGQLAWAALLHGIQETMSSANCDWRSLELQANALSDLIVAPKESASETAAGEEWWLEFGPVDLSKEIVTIQRQDEVLAAIQPREDGRLRVACYRVIEANTARILTGLGIHPHSKFGVCMRENNWEYALDSAGGMGNAYASMDGRTYRSYWKHGLGLDHEKKEVPEFFWQRNLIAQPPSRSAMQIGAWYTFSSEH